MKTPEEMIGGTVFTGAPKDDWALIPEWLKDIAAKIELEETRCEACDCEMVMNASSHQQAKAHPHAVIICLRCVCRAKKIPYLDPGSPKFAGTLQ